MTQKKKIHGTILRGSSFLNFTITIEAPKQIRELLASYIEHQLQQRGWIPDVHD